MTAMAVQALAPYYGTDAGVKEAVDKALECLSDIQDKDGGYASWGTKNAESCAQVMVALTALGIDPATDVRFIKDGHTVIEALLGFYVEGGGFRHVASGERNTMATEQGYYALAAYDRMLKGQTSLYDMTDVTIRKTLPEEPENNGSVTYRAHVQTYGWQNWKGDGERAGTEGEAKRLEGIELKVSDPEVSGGITYQAHVQTYGWQNWVSDGEMAGTEGAYKRLEAIRIKLMGEMEQKYDVYYRVHTQTYGWLDWAKNGEAAGTEGLGKRLEGLEVKLVLKGEAAPGETARPYIGLNSVRYEAHVQSYGWMRAVSDGSTAGTEGEARRLEGIRITLDNAAGLEGITYRAHVQTYGWQNWVSEGALAGTEGESKRLEALEIKLTGEMEQKYDIYYRAHVQSYGWLDWAKNGEAAGTEGLGKRLEAVQIVLVEKGAKAPGSTSQTFIKK